MNGMLTISAVVPVLQEAARVGALVGRLRGEVDEVVVVDGGSTDDTVDQARAAGARVLQGPRGRGRQMNQGAAAATGALLWFVHADAGVPAGAGAALRRAAAGADWGCFRVVVGRGGVVMAVTAGWMNARAGATGSATGDMGIWMGRDLFSRLGGFPAVEVCEDLGLTDRARAVAGWSVVSAPALGLSARRWEGEGMAKTVLRMWAVRAGYRLGVPVGVLARGWRVGVRG